MSKGQSLEYVACTSLVWGDAAPYTVAKYIDFSCDCRNRLSDRFLKRIC